MISQEIHTLLRMKSLHDIAIALRARAKRIAITQEELGEAAGISRRTLTHALSGTHDIKVTTLMAVADRLGLELTLIPKGAAQGMPAPDELGGTPPVVKTRIQQMLERDRERNGTDASSAR
jgi:transcriptional regulator with XRE-family HTH domain